MVRTAVGPGHPVRHVGHLVLHRLPRDVLQAWTKDPGREADPVPAVSDREGAEGPGHSPGDPIFHLGRELCRPGRARHDPFDHGPEDGPLLGGPFAAEGRRGELRRVPQLPLDRLGQPAEHLSAFREPLQGRSYMPPGGLARRHDRSGQVEGPPPPRESPQRGEALNVGARDHPVHGGKAGSAGLVDLEDPALDIRWKRHGSAGWLKVELSGRKLEGGHRGEPGRRVRTRPVPLRQTAHVGYIR